MSQAGYTPIQLYFSTTAAATPSAGNLANGELAVNITDGKLFYKDNGGVVRVLATKAGASGDVVGNLTFSGTAQRITGDFSNATIASRVMFQSTTVNGSTGVGAIPNGTAVTSAWQAFSKPDPTNSSEGALAVTDGFDVRISSGIRGTGTYLPMTFYTGGSERMRLDTSGNVGIGTSSPASYGKLVSKQSADTGVSSLGVVAQASTTDTFVGMGYSSVSDTCRITASYLSTGAFKPISFLTSDVERMRLDASGNLLVGYTAKGGTAVNSIVSANAYNCKAGSGAALGGNVFNINWTGSAQLWIDATNTGTITVTSDYRIKQKIETQAAPALARVMQLRPVTYELQDYGTLFKADGVAREGFIAHELQAIIPSAVEGEKDDPNQIQSLKLDALVSVLTKAIQEQQTLITSLTARITALETK